MDRLGEGLFGYWLPVAHATLLGGMDVAGNLFENISSSRAGQQRQRRRRRQQQDGVDTAASDDDDPRTVNGAPVVDLSGHVAIVTGGNAGIGLTSARKLAERGATVIIATRDARRGADAANLLRAAAARPLPGCQPGAVEDARLDLSSLDSVRSFARQFNASGRPLSLLLCNAGVMSPPERRSTSDGLELQLQTNAIGHFLLAHELLAHQRRQRRARASGSGSGGAAAVAAAADATTERPSPSTLALAPPGRGTRVVVLSSLTHHAGPAQWSDKQSLQRYGPFVSYALSKLAGVVWAVEMQRRFDAHHHHRGLLGGQGGGGGGGEEQVEGEKQKQKQQQQQQQQAPWWDGCPGRPSCSGCVVCEAEVEEGQAGGRRKSGGSSSAPSVLFGRDTAISLHPGIVATGLATGFFDRTAAAIAGSGGGGAAGGGATESAADAAASALAADAVAVAPVSSSSPSANSSPLAPLLERLYPWLLRSPEAAADGVLRACLAADDSAAGAYWHNGKPARASKFARDARRGAELWDYAVALCGAETDESLSK
jgi:NAD(P)-dependent dehydrogenase (short-subunit alcohol dehydrogenase family)